jgi:hypothetical protein
MHDVECTMHLAFGILPSCRWFQPRRLLAFAPTQKYPFRPSAGLHSSVDASAVKDRYHRRRGFESNHSKGEVKREEQTY